MKTFVVTYCWLWIGLFSLALAADPAKPALHTPVNQETGYNDAYFIWKLSVDPDGDAVVYDLCLGTDPADIPLYQDGIYDGFENDVMVGLSDGENLHLFIFTSLPDNTTYYWKVVARDGSSPVLKAIRGVLRQVPKMILLRPNRLRLCQQQGQQAWIYHRRWPGMRARTQMVIQ